jgi:anti-sigma-K factor RskA
MTNEREELQEMIGAYAVNATDDIERARIERFLAADADARKELARYEDALAALVTDETAVEPPADAWTSIAQRVAATRQIRPPGSHRHRNWLAVAAAVLVIALGGTFAAVRLGQDPSRASQMAAAQRDPAARKGALAGPAGQAAVAVRPDGHGYLDVDALAPIPAGKVYQLWSLDTAPPVSLGVVKQHSGIVTFTAAPSNRALALTVESAPDGAPEPTAMPVAMVELA